MLVTNNLLNNSIIENNISSIKELDNISLIPIIQISESFNIINYDIINNYCDNNDCSLLETMNNLIKKNNLSNLSLCITESDLILNPNLANQYQNIVLKPLNRNDTAIQFIDECVDMFFESGNENYINIDIMMDILNEKYQWSREGSRKPNKDFGLDVSYEDKKKLWDTDKSLEGKRVEYSVWTPGEKEGDKWKVTTLGTKVGKEYVGALKWIRNLTDKPRDFIAKTAARLREKYRLWLKKANEEHDTGKQKWYKNLARLAMKAIDYCMKKLENIHSSREDRVKDAAKDWHRKVKKYRYGIIGPKSVVSYSIDGKPMNVRYKRKEDLDRLIK